MTAWPDIKKGSFEVKNFMRMLREDFLELIRPVKPLTKWDYLCVLLAAIAAFLVFDTSSIVQTASASFGYLNRQFLNFYEYGRECGITDLSCMPAVYLTYAVWNLPLKLTFLVRYPMPEVPYPVLLWYKLLPVLLYLACAYLVYKIALEMGMGLKKSKLCAAAAFTMPVGFFLQFAYGQLMVMPLFFALLVVWFYLKDKRWGFIGCFALAIAYQQYMWVLFLPLLLLKEKRLRYLCEDILAASLPFAFEYLLYRRSIVFLKNVRVYTLEQGFAAGLDNGSFTIYYVLFSLIMVLGWAYFTSVKTKKELGEWALFFTGLVGVLTLCMTDWDAGYFMLLVPFSVLSAFLHRDIRIFLILDIGWAVLLAAYILVQRLELSGIGMAASLYTVLLLAMMIFRHPSFLAEKSEELPGVYAGWLRFRFIVGLFLCLLPALAARMLG